MNILKKISISFCIITFLVLSSVSNPPETASAESYTNIYWISFAEQLETYLWNFRQPNGECLWRNPRPGACLSPDKITKIMNQLTDPNGDGKYDDMYFKIADPAVRINYLKKTNRQPGVMKDIVLKFEESKTPRYKIYLANVDKSMIHAVNGAFLNNLSTKVNKPSEWFGDSDGTLSSLAFEIVSTNPKVFGIKPKNMITDSSLTKIYNTPRMSPYKAANRKLQDWQANEILELNKLLLSQNAIYAYFYQNSKLKPTAAKVFVEGLKTGLTRSYVQNADKYGGSSLLRSSQPSKGPTYVIGSQSITPDADLYLRLFQFSSTPSMAVRYESIFIKIIAGASEIVRVHKKRMPTVDSYLTKAVIDHRLYVASREYFVAFCEQEKLASGCYHPETSSIFYDENELTEGGPGGMALSANDVVMHEMFHDLRDYARERGAFSDIYGLFDEAYTSWITDKTAKLSGVPVPSYVGYDEKLFFSEIKKRLGKQRGFTLLQQDNYLMDIYFNAPYSAISSVVNKSNFYETLNTLFQQYDTASDFGSLFDYTDILGPGETPNPVVTKEWLNSKQAKKQEIINYIRN